MSPPRGSGSTLRGHPGILMDVHSVLLPGNRVPGALGFFGRVRLGNLLKDHDEGALVTAPCDAEETSAAYFE